jgi:hypothetical protein
MCRAPEVYFINSIVARGWAANGVIHWWRFSRRQLVQAVDRVGAASW